MKRLLLLMFLPSVVMTQTFWRQTEITRPANNTTYTAGDVVCGTDSLVSKLLPIVSGSGYGVIQTVRLDVDTLNTTNGTFRLFLFSDSTGQGLIADNAANAGTYAKDSLLIGYVDLTLESVGNASGTVAFDEIRDLNLHYKLPSVSSSTGIYGRLTATGAWVPKISGKIRIILIGGQ